MTFDVPRRVLAGAAALALTAAALTASSGAATAAPPPPSGWTQLFADDFNGAANSGLNTGDWLYDIGTGYPGGAANWGTGEIEYMTNSTQNVYQDGAGHLIIKPLRDGAGNWTSGRVETQRTDFAAPAGGKLRFEGSLQQPNVSGAAAAGYWPAFWSLGAAARGTGASGWPGIGEIDLMEDINGRSSEFATLHCGVAPGGPCNEYTGIGSGERACGGCQTGFHTYAMELDRSVSPEQIRWYLDGNNFFTVNANQVDATTWNNATHHGFFMILNVAIGGSFPAAFGGGPTGATQPGVPMVVDYVTAYSWTPGSGGSFPAASGTVGGPGGKCVDVAGDDTGGNGTAVQLWDCQSWAVDQHWTHNVDNSLSTLGRCLDINGNGTANGTPVQLWDCNGVGGQKWVQQSDGSLRNPQSGRCLDAPSGNTANGTRLQIWDCNGTGAQKFSVNGGGTIVGPGGKCVDVAGDDVGVNATAVQLWDCQAWAVDQHWVRSNSVLRTLGRCLDVISGGTANGTQVQLWDCNGTGAQVWQQQADGSVRNPQSGRCLDSPGGATGNGTRLQIWDCNGTSAQKFALS